MTKLYYKGKKISRSKFEAFAMILIYADYTLTHEEKRKKHERLLNGEEVDGLKIVFDN